MRVSSGKQRQHLGLRPVLISFCLFTLAAILLKCLAHAAPAPQRQLPSTIHPKGYRTSVVGNSPARRGRELSHGKIQSYQLSPLSGGMPLLLTLVPVRSRTSRQQDLQLAAMGTGVDATFQLLDRQLSTPEGQEVALGRGPADPSTSITNLQTCLTPSGQAGVTNATLSRLLNQERDDELRRRPLRTRLLRLSGLVPNSRWECLLVILQTTPGSSSADRLQAAWPPVRDEL